MRRARFRVVGKFDLGAGVCAGTVEIDRARNTFSVRPLRRRRTFDLPLDVVADIVVHRVVRVEVLAKKAAKRRGRV